MTDPAEIIRRFVARGRLIREDGEEGQLINELRLANFAIADLSTHVIVPRATLKIIYELIYGHEAADLRAMINHKDNAPEDTGS